ncbi:radical SAM protein [Candidatus Pacearchaeota archaeon]|nr:radical SAM protein [Candidatus Pacearchaeota archaeon]
MILKPIFCNFEITEGCTHRCVHCYNFYSENRSNNFAKKEIVDALIKNELFYVTITGGEPLMAKNILFSSIEKLRKANIDVSLNSNLYLLEKEDAKVIEDLKLNYVLSSILSSKEELHDKITQRKGSFKKLIKSLEFLVNEGVNISLNMVVSQANINEVYETGKFIFDNFGIKKFSATPVVPSTKRDEKTLMLNRKEYIHTLDNLLRLEKDFGIVVDSLHPAIPCMFEDDKREEYKIFFEKRGCAAGKGAITFSPEGDVRVCSHERRIYGNILKESLENILEKMQEWINGSFIPKECNSCAYIKKCNAGCRVSAEAITGNLNGLDPYFFKPIKEKIFSPESKIKIENVKSVNGNIRYREDNEKIITVYVNPKINARLNRLEFEVFKRFVSGKNYKEISEEIENKNITRKISKNLIEKGLLI